MGGGLKVKLASINRLSQQQLELSFVLTLLITARWCVLGESDRSSSSMVGERDEVRKGPWTEQEDLQLVWFVRLFGERRWDFLAKVSGLSGGG